MLLQNIFLTIHAGSVGMKCNYFMTILPEQAVFCIFANQSHVSETNTTINGVDF